MNLDRAKKVQTDIMTKVLDYERLPSGTHGGAAGLPRFRPKKAWLNADPLGPKTKLKDVDPRRVIGVAIALPPKGKPNGYGILVLCQRKSDMTGPYVTRAVAYAPTETRVVFTGAIRMASKKKRKSDKETKAKAAAKPKAKKKKKKAAAAPPPKTLQIGDSVGRIDGTDAGAIGCFVDVAGTQDVYILSANHVLADYNTGQPPDDIVSPALGQGGTKAKDKAAQLYAFEPLLFAPDQNIADCAIAKLLPGILADRTSVQGLPGAGGGTKQISGQAADPVEIERVRKYGWSTQGSKGEVRAVNLAAGWWVEDFNQQIFFSHQIWIDGTPGHFAWYGDSGAVVFNDGMDAVGMIIGISEEGGQHGGGITYASPMIPILDLLNATL